MFIQTETTPNPNTLKFLPGELVLAHGTAEFRDVAQAARSPLAQRLLRLTGVQGVFYGHDFISVTKMDDKEWALLKPLILGLVMDQFSGHDPLMNDETEGSTGEVGATPNNAINPNDDPTTQKIKDLLNTRVRPAVAMDGGDIQFHEFRDGVVYVQLKGACAGCPSSTMTLKAGIENMLRHYIPEVSEVRAVA
jgi:Fe-S cluster biogenesis protein NfuA